MNDLHQHWPHRWLSPKVEAHTSPIQGIGVFAKQRILKDEPVGVLGGVIVHKNQIREYWKVMNQVGIQIDEDFFIVPTTREELEHYGVFNHSCEPNLGFSSSLTLIALRDIEPGEECVFDYAFNESFYDGFICHCGVKTCRRTITLNDWKIKEIQKKYRIYFSPYLRDKI